MSSLHWRPALKYNLYQGLRGLGAFFAVIIFVMILVPALVAVAVGGRTEIGFSGLGLGSNIMFFVLGIMMVRENIKFLLQNGCGRRTLLITDVLGNLILALITALISELLAQIFGSTHLITEISLSEMFFSVGGSPALPAAQSALLRFCALVLAWRGGMFVSLIYYRLNRLGQVAVSVIVPALLFIGLPLSADRGLIDPALFTNAFQWLISSPYNTMLAAVITALLCGVCSWPLLRRAQVKG